MNIFQSADCSKLFYEISQLEQLVTKENNPQKRLPPELRRRARTKIFDPALALSVQADLPESSAMVFRLKMDFEKGKPIYHDLLAALRPLRRLMQNEMLKRLFLTVPENLSGYYDQERPLGDSVRESFPSATEDLTAAGSCLACGLNLAAAFHLMRAAEIGLWTLGKDRQIPLALSAKIEFTEWGAIIGELEVAVKDIQKWQNCPAKEQAHKFYNTAVVEIRAFNDGYRRHTAHVRLDQPPMEPDEALALWGHVSRFLKTLATKIGEDKHMPLQWL